MSQLSVKEQVININNSENLVYITEETENELFDQLTQEEKLELSELNPEINRPTLNIYRNIWVYIEELEKWMLIHSYNTWKAELSYNPSFVAFDHYVLCTETGKLYIDYAHTA